MTEAWLQEAGKSMERLKWLVLRRFSVLPRDASAQRMTEADFVWCGLQMLLDASGGHGLETGEGGVNGSFDAARFENMEAGA